MNDPIDTPLKLCTACNKEFPATLLHFHAYKRSKDGLRNLCKNCRSKQDRQHRKDHHQHYLEKESKRRKTHKESYRESDRKYRQSPKGKENQKERQRRYRNKYPELILQTSRAYYWAHHEECLKSLEQYRIGHREEMRARNRAYHKAHPGKSSNYLRAHPEVRRAHQAKRRARKLSASGSYTAQDIEKQYRAQKGKCYWCSQLVGKYHVDHVVPLTRGGSNDPSNLVIACPTCNLKRNNKLPHEWPEGGHLL